MDPLTALSVAGTIVQFVEFGSKLLTSSFQLYKSSRGSLEAHEELTLITEGLQGVMSKLQRAILANATNLGQSLIGDDADLQGNFHKLCDEATTIAEELLQKLNSLRVKDGKHRRWESLKAAVRSAWSKDEISALKTRLFALRDALQSRFILSMEAKIDATSFKLSNRFDSQTQHILEAIAGRSESLSQEVLNSLMMLVRRSDRVNEDEHHKTRQMIADLRKDLASRSSDTDVIIAQVEMLSVEDREEQKLRNLINRRILEELSYPGMTNRYEDISEAHFKTFDWIFSDAENCQLPWSDFGKWLRNDSDIYWINGKAGSGKSTLMKHIYDDKRTKQNLQFWINKHRLVPFHYSLATFFFWNSGTKLQQSQQGLLRSILIQILGEHKNLIPIIFPTRWAELYGRETLDITNQTVPKTWSLLELQAALDTLLDQKQYPLKLCFLIDGLDEFSEDAEQLCLFFKRLNERSDRAKFCLSSRPWVQFQQNFEGSASLRLQDLTSNDIHTYVNDKFSQSAAFRRLATRDAELTSSLTREIMERAEGVFLWVEVVVRLLLKGINNSDTIPELWSRLKSFPKELSPLYNSILSQIEPLYQVWASKAFQIMGISMKLSSDPFQKISSLKEANKLGTQEDPGVKPLTLLGLLLALNENWAENDLAPIPLQEVLKLYKEFHVHLTARCAGLLEVNTLSPGAGGLRIHQVRWMHRTARDFIEQDDKWMKLVDPPGFSPYLAMMRSCILCMTRIYSREYRANQYNYREFTQLFSIDILSTAKDALIYAYHANGDIPSRTTRTHLLKMIMYMPPATPSESFLHGETFLHRAAMHCLSDFVEDILSTKPRAIQLETSSILLQHLCGNSIPLGPFDPQPFPTARMVDCLLKLANFTPTRISGTLMHKHDRQRWPGLGVVSPNNHSSLIGGLTRSRFIESQLSIIETFLKHSLTLTWTGSEYEIPHDFVFQKEILLKTAEERLQTDLKSTLNVGPIMKTVEDVLKDAIREHQKQKERASKKRKHCAMVETHIIEISDESDDEEVIFLSERPVGDKRVKMYEDD